MSQGPIKVAHRKRSRCLASSSCNSQQQSHRLRRQHQCIQRQRLEQNLEASRLVQLQLLGERLGISQRIIKCLSLTQR